MFRDGYAAEFAALDDKSVANSRDAAPPPRQGDTVPAGISGAGTITVGRSITVSIETRGDHDWYAVTLEAGKTYTFHTTFDASNTDAYLSLRNGSGAEVAANDDGGEANNALISYAVPTSGTYYIDAGTWDDLTTAPDAVVARVMHAIASAA